MGIYYKFRSFKNFSMLKIDGNSMPLWELRNEIINVKKLTNADFILSFYDYESGDEITDDTQMVYINSYVVVVRTPATMNYKKYRNSVFSAKLGNGDEKEVDRNAKAAKQKTVQFGYVVPGSAEDSEKHYSKAVPSDYLCFRCGHKGHFIQHCPTNNNKNFDIPSIKKPTGIPKSFLVPVKGSLESTMLITQDGGMVRAEPQIEEWKKINTIRVNREIQKEFRCPICDMMFNFPIATNCGHTFCNDCISIGNTCPVCCTLVATVEDDVIMRQKLDCMLENS